MAPSSHRAQWAVDLGIRIVEARRRVGLTQKALAAAAGISPVWLSKIERGGVAKYPYDTLAKLTPLLDTFAPASPSPSTARLRSNVIGRSDELRTREARRVPIYRWGSRGDPRDDSAPNPERMEFPPVGRESLVGVHGFGVVVEGETMAGRGIHAGDTVWVNPDRPTRPGWPVLARAWASQDPNDEIGLVVKTVAPGSEWELFDEPAAAIGTRGQVPFPCDHFVLIGPIVGISPAFRLPS